MGTIIKGLGFCVPEKVLSNKELEKMVDTSDTWITERTGIKERRIAPRYTPNSFVACNASTKALEKAGIEPSHLDGIIVATVTPDMKFPSTACFLQKRLGANNAFSFDIHAACTGFIYGLAVADSLIKTEVARHILVCGSELLSTIVDNEDRNTCVLFGDGAGAVVLGPGGDGEGVVACRLHSDGNLWDLIQCPGGGTVHPVGADMLKNKLQFITMKGNDTFKKSVICLTDVSREVLNCAGLTIADIDLFIPHQANLRIIQAVAKRLGVPKEKTYLNLLKYGNTSSASIPIAMSEAWGEGTLKKGDTLLISAFGAGLTWGAALVKMAL